MARRVLEIDGERWAVYPAGPVTVYDRDEFGLMFEKGTGPDRIRRFTRYSPLGARRRDAALAELSESQLSQLFRASQISLTSPEGGYGQSDG
ncbi:MAG: hypothetical protein JSW71_13585 [Gemmatimonadota bacterium]|nr:MAG: hypothetical protein JSW71_13585 [Gemmatimonadota bacterium]